MGSDHDELRWRIATVRAERIAAEREGARLRGFEVALQRVERDYRPRTSPELEKQRQRGENLRRRLHKARAEQDAVEARLLRVLANWHTLPALEEADDGDDDDSVLPGGAAMSAALADLRSRRQVADSIGKN